MKLHDYIHHVVTNLWDDELQSAMEEASEKASKYSGFETYTPKRYLEYIYSDCTCGYGLMLPSTFEWKSAGNFVEAHMDHYDDSNLSIWSIFVGPYSNQRSKDIIGREAAMAEWSYLQTLEDVTPDQLVGYYDSSEDESPFYESKYILYH